jgi:hypothetical protein
MAFLSFFYLCSALFIVFYFHGFESFTLLNLDFMDFHCLLPRAPTAAAASRDEQRAAGESDA